MSWGYSWRPYVPVAQRRANARRAISKMKRDVSPVVIEGRTIASTFWGKAWCDNLESYSDFANRLPRGRTYVRNGSVMDLQIAKGKVTSLVSGSELYKIEILIKPLPEKIWSDIQKECAGKIDSMIELLQGRLSSGVMQVVTRREKGLFPAPREISMKCSCPDWAEMCKHVAATLYGVGARLDEKPELLFLLRGVDPEDLISQVSAAEAIRPATPAEAALAESELADVFGIELDSSAAPAGTPAPIKPVAPSKRSKVPKQAKAASPARGTAAGKAVKKPARKASAKALGKKPKAKPQSPAQKS